MVDTQVRPSDVTKFPIIDAKLSVPRELFVPCQQAETSWLIGHSVAGQAFGDGRIAKV